MAVSPSFSPTTIGTVSTCYSRRERVGSAIESRSHIHLALQAGDIPLSRGMQNLSFRYTRWINRREKRTGHLFQERYKAILVDADSYLLELVRYIPESCFCESNLTTLKPGPMTQCLRYSPTSSILSYGEGQ